MASSDTSYSFNRLAVLKTGSAKEPTREIIESLVVQEKGKKGDALIAAVALVKRYTDLGWKVDKLDNQPAIPGVFPGRYYLLASRKVGSATLEVYFTSIVGRDSESRCSQCGATWDFGKKAFCQNCSTLVEPKKVDPTDSW